jgi:hypothetical protein
VLSKCSPVIGRGIHEDECICSPREKMMQVQGRATEKKKNTLFQQAEVPKTEHVNGTLQGHENR